MINLFYHEHNSAPVKRLMGIVGGSSGQIRPVVYQDVFRRLKMPMGTAIFTDMEFLNPLQLEVAASMASAIQRNNGNLETRARVLNHPAYVQERFQLLRTLKAKSLSSLDVIRLDSGEAPPTYPCFIRSENGCYGPETDLLQDEIAYRQAVETLQAQDRPMKGRIAVSYKAQASADGLFRKYAACRFGDEIVPQHILFNTHWVVKRQGSDFNEARIVEELDYISTNPHKDHLLKVFEAGNIEFGRVDYSIVDGAPVIYEINVNPTIPKRRPGTDDRLERSNLVVSAMTKAIDKLDDGTGTTKWYPISPKIPSHEFVETRSWGPVRARLWKLRRSLRKRQLKGD